MADKTWDNFTSFFLIAQTNRMFSRRATAGRQGYGHWAQKQAANSDKEIDNGLTEALELLATAANDDRTAFATISSSNQQLTSQLTEAMKRLGDLENQLNQKGGGEQNKKPLTYTVPNNKNYCHTHGYIIADDHTSATATRKATATRTMPTAATSWAVPHATSTVLKFFNRADCGNANW